MRMDICLAAALGYMTVILTVCGFIEFYFRQKLNYISSLMEAFGKMIQSAGKAVKKKENP